MCSVGWGASYCVFQACSSYKCLLAGRVTPSYHGMMEHVAHSGDKVDGRCCLPVMIFSLFLYLHLWNTHLAPPFVIELERQKNLIWRTDMACKSSWIVNVFILSKYVIMLKICIHHLLSSFHLHRFWCMVCIIRQSSERLQWATIVAFVYRVLNLSILHWDLLTILLAGGWAYQEEWGNSRMSTWMEDQGGGAWGASHAQELLYSCVWEQGCLQDYEPDGQLLPVH